MCSSDLMVVVVVVVQASLVGGMKDSHNYRNVGAIHSLGNLSQGCTAYHDVGGTSCVVGRG